MIVKTIQYEDYEDNTVKEDFYFHLSKLEMIEMEIQFEGGLEGHLEKITETQDVREVYDLFKDILISAHGIRSADGKKFYKSEEIRRDFAGSPALGELILHFIANPEEGASFIEECLPGKLVREAKAAAKNNKKDQGEATPVLPTAAPVLEGEQDVSNEKVKTSDAKLSLEDIATMPKDEFDKLDPKKLSHEQMQAAFARRFSGS